MMKSDVRRSVKFSQARKSAQELEGSSCSVYCLYNDGTGGEQHAKSLRGAIFEVGYLNAINEGTKFKAWLVRDK